jgi:hypothetical protein
MDPEERTLPDSLQRHCAICGAELTTQEIQAAREGERAFLCTVHAAEELPVEVEGAPPTVSGEAEEPGPPEPGP